MSVAIAKNLKLPFSLGRSCDLNPLFKKQRKKKCHILISRGRSLYILKNELDVDVYFSRQIQNSNTKSLLYNKFSCRDSIK